MKKEEWNLIIEVLEEIIPKVEHFRAKNVNKYNAEKSTEYGGEYQKMEKYKTRVRVTDIFLPSLKKFVEKAKKLNETTSAKSDEIS
jgi:hypothetical protein